ncbi:MoaD/ThiS family protein, partial [Chloroflexota bacterium]
KTFGGDQVELDEDNVTLNALLELLTEQSGGSVRFNAEHTDSESHHYVVLLNGNEISSLSGGFNTELADGDEVSIAPVDLLFSGG